MKMTLTDQQRNLLKQRKSPDLRLSEFLEVTLLQIQVQIVEKGLVDAHVDRIAEFRRRIQEIGSDPMMSVVGKLQMDLNQYAQEILFPPKKA